MKKILYLALPALLAATVSSCDEKARLASDIEGSWSGTPERIYVSDAASSTITRIFTFIKGDSNAPATVIADVTFSTEQAVQPSDSIVQPVTVTATGSATISGTWSAIDDDEIAIVFDYSTMKVDVDPEAITVDYDILSSTDTPQLEALRPAMAQSVKTHLTKVMTQSVFDFARLDDIKIKGNIMSCEIHKKDLTFHRSAQ